MSFFQTYLKKQVKIVPPPSWNSKGDPIQYNLLLSANIDSDNQKIWQLQMPPVFASWTSNYVSVRKGTIFIYGSAAGYPTNMNLNADEAIGYIDQLGNQTSVIAIFTLKNVQPLATTPVTYNLTYQMASDTLFQITNPYLILKLYYDMGPFITTPLSFVLPLRLDILSRTERKTLKMTEQNTFEDILKFVF